jgi:uncharacterized protein
MRGARHWIFLSFPSSARECSLGRSCGLSRLEDDMNPLSKLDETTLTNLCERHRIRSLALFGSQLKGTARPDSDIDLLVEFFPEARTTLLDMAQIEIELSEALDGRKVDLRTPQDLSRYFRDEVVRTAQVQYIAG